MTAKPVPSVSVFYARNGSSTRANTLGMRPPLPQRHRAAGEAVRTLHRDDGIGGDEADAKGEGMIAGAPDKKIIIIAGPNGAGKTTFARSFLPAEAQLPRFINADLIAAGFAPFAPETAAMKAGRLMLQEIAQCAQRGESFAFETTLSGHFYLRHIAEWRAQGYRVSLFFLMLPNVETAIARVAARVRQGGHDIPEPVIRRRFDAGWNNFQRHYKHAVDDWALYDNAGAEPAMREWGENQ
jgi:predicted ABC-type ATPase